MQFLTILKLILSMLPLIIDAIKLIEATIPGQGQGELKLAAIRSAVESSYEVSEESLPSFELLWKAVSKVIARLVAVFNSSGQFEK